MLTHPAMLVPVAPIAQRAVLPDDPGVALKLATTLLDDDRLMANHHRGLWGYTGSGRDGLGPLTIQSTGVGAASASLVLDELIAAGVTAAIRAGTARTPLGAPPAAALYAVTEAIAGGQRATLDRTLTAALTSGAGHAGPVESIGPHDDADAVHDLETAPMAARAHAAGIRFAAVLALTGGLDHLATADATHAAGVLAGAALSGR